MKARELKNALTYVGDDEEVEFLVNDSSRKGLTTYVAEPTHAQITSKWKWPERGELSPVPDDLPKTMTIHLEI